MNFSIIIPLYNEEIRFQQFFPMLLIHLETILKKGSYEIICVNDGSKDRTKRIVERYKKELPYLRLINVQKNKGKGNALRTGVKAATGSMIFFTDIDLSADINTLSKFVTALSKNADIVIASRLLKKSNVEKRQGIIRQSMGKVYTRMTKVFLGLPYVDMTCGLKGGNSKPMKAIFSKMRVNRWSFDPEMLFLAKKHGFRVKEFPVKWVNNEQSKVNVLVDALRSFSEVLMIRINDILGYYG